MIQEVILYFKIKPLLRKLGDILTMPLSMSTFLQALAVLAQVLNLLLPVVTGKGKAIVATAIGITQVILHNYAGNTNPDGTPVAATPKG